MIRKETIGNATLICGDCLEVMPMLIEEGVKVDAVVTSPPYDNLREYNGNNKKWHDSSWKKAINYTLKILHIGGIVIWIVNDATINGSETGTSFKQALYAVECGFNLHDTMIWHKGTFTAVGSLKLRYAQVFEYMFVFSKSTPKTFNPIKDRKNKHFGETITGNIRQKDGSVRKMTGCGKKTINKTGQRFNVWEISAEKSRIETSHPAQFPEKIAKDHIISWSNQNETILDPFMGSGTTGVAALQMNRKFIGIELDPDYFDIACRRIEEANKQKDLFYHGV